MRQAAIMLVHLWLQYSYNEEMRIGGIAHPQSADTSMIISTTCVLQSSPPTPPSQLPLCIRRTHAHTCVSHLQFDDTVNTIQDGRMDVILVFLKNAATK